jgi:hypothetical protein
VWRLTHLLVHEAGPAALFERLRAVPALSPLLGCFYCCSLWTALPPALLLGEGWAEIALLCLGLSGTAIVIERLSAPALPPPPLWHESEAPPAALPTPSKPEDSHVLLRR